MREATRTLHARAERSGVVRDLLADRATRRGYALLLRNLYPVYVALECGLESHRLAPALGALAMPAVYRAAAIETDLRGLAGAAWAQELPTLPAGERYAARVAAAASGDGARLIAHAYVRYMGDLNGGAVLRRVLGRSLALEPATLNFHDFSPADAASLRTAYRTHLNAAGAALGPAAAGVIAEAVLAFDLNIVLSEAVAAAAAQA